MFRKWYFTWSIYDKHILQTVSAFLLIYSCNMNVSVTYLEYFKKYGKLKFNNQAKVCVQICPTFADRSNTVKYFRILITQFMQQLGLVLNLIDNRLQMCDLKLIKNSSYCSNNKRCMQLAIWIIGIPKYSHHFAYIVQLYNYIPDGDIVASYFVMLLFVYFSNIALLKMKYKIDADIRTDEWPNFKCTVIKLPMSQVSPSYARIQLASYMLGQSGICTCVTQTKISFIIICLFGHVVN